MSRITFRESPSAPPNRHVGAALKLPLRMAMLRAMMLLGTVLLGTLASLASAEEAELVHPEAIQAASSLHVLQFGSELLNTPPASAQKLTATFSVSGYAGSFTPTAAMHYGHDYTLGAVSCSPGGGGEDCSVDVTFAPTLPGGRKDAIFLMNGTTRIGTLLVYGIGQGPLSAVEPGVVSYATALPFSNYYYGSTIDENGIIYSTTNAWDTVYRIAKDGTVTTLDVVGARGIDTIAIDGAGILYLGCYNSIICTYDTVLGTVGSIPVPWTTYKNDFQETVTIDGVGDLFSIEPASNNGIIEELKANGTSTSTTLNPELLQPDQITTDADGNVFVGGYYINELTTGGVQTQLNNLGAFEGVLVDASETLYATRYNGSNNNRGVAELPPSDYTTANGFLDTTDRTGDPLGIGLGSDGTLGVGVYQQFDIVDRTHGAIDFGTATIASTATQTADIRNIGNESLTISSIEIAGDGFALAAGSGDCVANLVLGAGEICNLVVTWTPTHSGDFPGTVTVVSNSLGVPTTQIVTLNGTVDGAYLSTSPSAINFGNQPKGTATSAQSITLTDNGDYPARITGIVSSDPAFAVSVGNCESTNVAVGGNCQLTATFTPSATAPYSATISVTYSSAGSSIAAATTTIPLTGTGTGPPTPVVSLTPTTLAFGSQYIGFPGSAQSAALSNTGNGPLTIASILLGGVNPTDFSETTTCGSTLAAGASCQISAMFMPASAATLSATVTVTDNASGSPNAVTLTGTGVAVPIATLTPGSLNFGNQNEGSSSAVKTLTLSNPSSTITLNFDAISISGASSASYAQTNNCVPSVAPGGSCTVSVTFTPASAGALAATLQITSRYPGFSPVAVSSTLTGTGIAPPTPTFTPSTLAFGNQVAGTSSAPLTTTLTNTGTDTLVIDGLGPVILGTGASAITATDSCPATLAPGATCTLSATFTPSTVGAYSLTINISAHYASSAGFEVYPTANITGTGTAPPTPTFTPPTLAFGNQIVGTNSAVLTTTLTNTGTDTLVISGSFPTILGTGASAISAFSNCPATLAPGGTCTLSATFTPSTIGSYSLGIKLSAHYANTPGIDVSPTANVTGTGIAVPVPTVAPASIDFGVQTVGTSSAAKTVTFTNPAAVSLTVDSVGLTGAGIFQITSNCGATIAAGASCQVSATFTPTVAAPLVDTLSMEYHYGGLAPSYVSMSLFGTSIRPPAPTLTPAFLGFGSQTVYTTSAAQTLTFSNSAAVPVAIDSVAINDSVNFKESTNCGATLAAGASCGISIAFAPTRAYPFTPSVSLKYNFPGEFVSEIDIPVSGLGVPPPAPTATPGSLAFGNWIVNTTSASQSVALSMPAAAGRHINSISLAGAGASNFSETTNCAADVPASASCLINVVFTPASVAALSASLQIIDQITGEPATQATQTVVLTGTGVPVPSQPALSATTLNFGSQPRGAVVPAQTITLSNPGKVPLLIGSIASADPVDFTVTNTCGTSVAAGAACQIGVSFTPSLYALRVSTLNVITQYSGLSPTTETVALTGTGVRPPAPTFAPSSLDFGSAVLLSPSAPQTLTITNPTAAAQPIRIDSILFQPATDFTQTTNCPASLVAGASCQIQVTFAPSSLGAITAILRMNFLYPNITPSAGDTYVSTTVTGTGLAIPPPVFTPASLAFGNVVIGATSTPQTITLTNPAEAGQPIKLASFSFASPGLNPVSDNCTGTLAAGASCQLQLTLTPTSVGAISGFIRLAYLYASDPPLGSHQLTANLTATGLAIPPPVFSPASLAFGNVVIGATSAPQTITLTNPAGAGQQIELASFSFASPGLNPVSDNCTGTLAAGASCQLQLTLTPTSVGAISGFIRLAYLYASDPPLGSHQLTANLTATGTPAPAPIVSLSTTSLDFGNQVAGSTSAAKQVTVSNTGNAGLFFTSIGITDGFPGIFAQTNTCGTNLPAGASCIISLTFAPANTTLYSATLQLVDDDPSSNFQNIALTGTGIAQPPLVIDLSAASAIVRRGDSTSVSVTVGSAEGGYHADIMLGVSGLPAGVTADFVPASLASGPGAATSMLTFHTTSTAAQNRNSLPLWPAGSPALALLFFVLPKRVRSRLSGRVLLVLLMLGALGTATVMTGCGGNIRSTTSMITITATSGGVVQTSTIQLTVN